MVCQRRNGQVRITIPPQYGDGGILTKGFVGHPARPEPVRGVIQGKDLVQYDFTPEQYRALIKLTATLCKALPKIKCDYPKDAAGNLIRQKLPDAELKAYQGVLGHYHIQTNKVDPGPALPMGLRHQPRAEAPQRRHVPCGGRDEQGPLASEVLV